MAKIKITYIDDFVTYDEKLKKSMESRSMSDDKAEVLYAGLKQILRKKGFDATKLADLLKED